ncbi:MAG TPA: hypothetical protein VNA69_17745 [Thermoanaerobaculia bacterium]|nr:hypothetical protein [Thermoanaerobaculia bacterium]
MTDAYKQYNEALKLFESLGKREAELLQKLSQADGDVDLAQKHKWATELADVILTTQQLDGNRCDLLRELRTAIPRSAEGVATAIPKPEV